MRKKKTPYQRIMAAEARGGGIRLSPEDVFLLSMDDAISTRASNDDDDDAGIGDADHERPAVKRTGEGTTIEWLAPQNGE